MPARESSNVRVLPEWLWWEASPALVSSEAGMHSERKKSIRWLRVSYPQNLSARGEARSFRKRLVSYCGGPGILNPKPAQERSCSFREKQRTTHLFGKTERGVFARHIAVTVTCYRGSFARNVSRASISVDVSSQASALEPAVVLFVESVLWLPQSGGLNPALRNVFCTLSTWHTVRASC